MCKGRKLQSPYCHGVSGGWESWLGSFLTQSAPSEGAERRAGMGMLEELPQKEPPRERPLHRLVWYLLESSVTAQWILYLTLPGLISSPVGMLGKMGRALHLLKEIRFYFVSYIGVYLRPSLKKSCCSHCRSQVGASGLGSGSVPDGISSTGYLPCLTFLWS